MDLKVAQMPAGKDPADLAKDDLEELKNCLKNSKHIIDFYVDSLLSRKMESRQLGKEIQKNVLPYIAILQSNIEKSHFIKSIARKTLIKEDALWDDLKRVGIGTAADTPTSASDIPNGATTSASGRSDAIERRIVGVILWRKSPEVRKKFLETVGDERGKEILEKFERDESLLFETESYYNGNDNPSKDISELLTSLQEEILKKKLAEAMIFLNKAEQMRDSERISKYLEECQIISQKINNLKNVQKK
jgi:DNA primase